MRVVGGKYKNRRIHPPHGMAARPTTDFAKEGLFNVLQHSIPLEGIRVLDLFAGTGNMSLEFLSRGANEVVSVEQDRALLAFMQRTATELAASNWRVVKGEVFTFLKSHRSVYDIVFADPPFHMEGPERVPEAVMDGGLLTPEGILIMEHEERLDMSTLPGYLRTRTYGVVHFSLFGRSRP